MGLPPMLSALALWGVVVLDQPLLNVEWALLLLMLNIGSAPGAATRLGGE